MHWIQAAIFSISSGPKRPHGRKSLEDIDPMDCSGVRIQELCTNKNLNVELYFDATCLTLTQSTRDGPCRISERRQCSVIPPQVRLTPARSRFGNKYLLGISVNHPNRVTDVLWDVIGRN